MSRVTECSSADGHLPTRSLPDGSLPELIRVAAQRAAWIVFADECGQTLVTQTPVMFPICDPLNSPVELALLIGPLPAALLAELAGPATSGWHSTAPHHAHERGTTFRVACTSAT